MFSSELISVVIQGPLYRNEDGSLLVNTAIKSLRKLLPHSEIIVSTWNNESIVDVEADLVLQNEFPNPLIDVNGNAINVGAQIRSTLSGIKNASRPFVLKFRADLSLIDLSIIEEYFRFEKNKKSLSAKPLIVTNLFTRNPVRFPVLFHLSDIVQFGNKSDMYDFWASKEPSAVDIFLTGRKSKLGIIGNYLGHSRLRVLPEQYLMLSWLSRRGVEVKLKTPSQINFKLLRLWEECLLENFYVINWEDSGIKFPPRFFTFSYASKTIYQQKDLKRLSEIFDSKLYLIRYIKVQLKKYLFCWVDMRYWLSVFSVILFRYFPVLALKVKSIYRRFSKSGKV